MGDRVRRHRGDVLAVEQHLPARGRTRPTNVRTSVVLPMPLRPIRPMVSPPAMRKRDATQDMALAVVGVEPRASSKGVDVSADGIRHALRDRRPARWCWRELPPACLGQHRAFGHHRHPVGDREHDVHVVLDQQHRVLACEAAGPPCARFPRRPCRRAARPAAAPWLAGERHGDLELPLLTMR